MKPEFYFHIGHGKTGSSYIQACLSCSKLKLEKEGLIYPQIDKFADIHHKRALSGNISMGNFLRAKGATCHSDELIKKVHALTTSYSENTKFIFSNESLFRSIANHGYLDNLETLSVLGHVTCILCIRDPIEHFISVAMHARKSGKKLNPTNYRVLKTVKKILKIFHDSTCTLKIINYSRCKSDLLFHFCQILAVDQSLFVKPIKSLVNRSMTNEEQFILDLLRAKRMHAQARRFVDTMSNQFPDFNPNYKILNESELISLIEESNVIANELNLLLPESCRYHVPKLSECQEYLLDDSSLNLTFSESHLTTLINILSA